jgi:hypothetical protein
MALQLSLNASAGREISGLSPHRCRPRSPAAAERSAGPRREPQRGVDHGPTGTVVCRGLGAASPLLGNGPAQFGSQPGGQPRAGPDRRHRPGERGPGTCPFHTAAPSPFVPEQPQSRCPIGNIARSGADQAFERDREHPTVRTHRRGSEGSRCEPPGPRTRPIRLCRLRDRPSPTEATRLRRNPFEHAECA